MASPDFAHLAESTAPIKPHLRLVEPLPEDIYRSGEFEYQEGIGAMRGLFIGGVLSLAPLWIPVAVAVVVLVKS